MKKIIFSIAVMPLIFSACTKSGGNSNGNNGGGNGGGGNGGGGNGGGGTSITITSISPTNPYPDDEFTIIGTGFNSDATKDTVEFGHLFGSAFGAWHDGVESEWASLCTIVSATETQLKVKAVNTFALDYNAYSTGATSIAVAQVRTGGKKAVTPAIPFKRLLLVGYISNPDLSNGAAIGRPGDSLIIGGKGFRTSGVSVSIGSTQVQNFKIDSTPDASHITFRLPKTFFGNENDESISQDKVVSVSNPDGKTISKTFSFLISPQMSIYSMKSDAQTYSIGTLNGNGGQVIITVLGRNLKSDAVVKLDGVGIHTQAGLQVSGFQDNIILNFSPGSLIAGNLQVSIWRGNTLYGICNFKVNS